MRMRFPRAWAAAAVLTATALVTAGCTASGAGSGDGGAGRLHVLASFYPLQYVAAQVGGGHVDVTSLTPPGAEPHDVELSPREVRSVGEADLVVYLSGFQPSVDEAVAGRAPAHVVDAAATEGTGALPEDPHFWLDPTLLAAVADDVADGLAEADPAHAADYAAGAERLGADLAALDADLTRGLADCERRVVVTAHEAFGYLAARYDLEQVGISGLDPEAEPSPARLREIRDVVEERGVTTIFTESLLNPKVSRTLADDLGIGTAVLDPVESQVDPDADYRDAMEQNLEVLRAALDCA